MSEQQTKQWIARCAARLQNRIEQRYEDALEMAQAILERCRHRPVCPERAAEAFLGTPLR